MAKRRKTLYLARPQGEWQRLVDVEDRNDVLESHASAARKSLT